MSSKNAGEQEGKGDYALLFEDFPVALEGTLIEFVIDRDWSRLLEDCVAVVGWAEVLKVREYGVAKTLALIGWHQKALMITKTSCPLTLGAFIDT